MTIEVIRPDLTDRFAPPDPRRISDVLLLQLFQGHLASPHVQTMNQQTTQAYLFIAIPAFGNNGMHKGPGLSSKKLGPNHL